MVDNFELKSKEEIERIIVASGGNGRGIGVHLGAIVPLLEHFEEEGKTIDAWVGTSAGAVVGAWIANNPSMNGAKEAKEIYLQLKSSDVFGNWWQRNIIPLWRIFKTKFDFNAVDSIGDSEPIKRFLDNTLPNIEFRETKIPLVVTFDDISNYEFKNYNSWDTPEIDLPFGAYTSSAQPPFLEPTYWSNTTLIDGGNAEVVPFKTALRLFPNLKEVWILAASDGNNGSKKYIHGLANIIQESFSSRINQEIKDVLELARNTDDGIETHIIIDGRGAPHTPFFDWFDKSDEIVIAGEINMVLYLKNPKPVILRID